MMDSSAAPIVPESSVASPSQQESGYPLQLYSGSTKTDSKTHSGGPMPPMPLTPRPGYEQGTPRAPSSLSRPGSSRPGSSRPGSEKHPVLPPIGSASKVVVEP